MWLALDKQAHGGPVHCRAHQEHHIAYHQRDEVHAHPAHDHQCRAEGGQQQHHAKIAQGGLTYAMPGMHGEQAHQAKNEDGNYQERRYVQHHVLDPEGCTVEITPSDTCLGGDPVHKGRNCSWITHNNAGLWTA